MNGQTKVRCTYIAILGFPIQRATKTNVYNQSDHFSSGFRLAWELWSFPSIYISHIIPFSRHSVKLPEIQEQERRANVGEINVTVCKRAQFNVAQGECIGSNEWRQKLCGA